MRQTIFAFQSFRRIAGAACALMIGGIVAGCSSTSTPSAASTTDGIASVDPQVHDALVTSCYDCHSNQAPAWNARLAPSYLFGAGKARDVLNFSDWQAYSPQRRRSEVEAIGKVIEANTMPPGDYDLVHPGARLTDAQKKAVLAWVSAQTPTAH
jgi:cytochrome c553